MFLTDTALLQILPSVCSNYHPSSVGPASLDVHLSDDFLRPSFTDDFSKDTFVYDPKDSSQITQWVHKRQPSIILKPGEFILASTEEHFVFPADLCGDIRGKSTIGRSGLGIELAGFIDPGFQGTLTLEIVNHLPYQYKLHAGQRIAQIRFFPVVGVLTSYGERHSYQNQIGATKPKFDKLFQEMK